MSDKQLKGCIEWLESILKYDRWLLDPSTQTLLQQTVNYLEELKQINEQSGKEGKNGN